MSAQPEAPAGYPQALPRRRRPSRARSRAGQGTPGQSRQVNRRRRGDLPVWGVRFPDTGTVRPCSPTIPPEDREEVTRAFAEAAELPVMLRGNDGWWRPAPDHLRTSHGGAR